MSSGTVYIGIDMTAGKRPATVAILSDQLDVKRLAHLPYQELAPLMADYPHATCGIDAPSKPNQQLLARPDYRQRVGLPARGRGYQSYRVAEYELRKHGVNIYNTPDDLDKVPGWMQKGWELYEALRMLGYVDYPAVEDRVLFETYPHACYSMLAKGRTYTKSSLEGRMQRQLILYEQGINVPDAMSVMEEWTRHHFLMGKIVTRDLYDHDQLDALVAAFTAYLARREPDRVKAWGDPLDGYIVLPARALADTY